MQSHTTQSHTPPARHLQRARDDYSLGRGFGKTPLQLLRQNQVLHLNPPVSAPFPSVSSRPTGAASDRPSPLGGDPGKSLSIYPEAPLPVLLAEPILSLPTKFHWWFSAKAAHGEKTVKKGRGHLQAQVAGTSVS